MKYATTAGLLRRALIVVDTEQIPRCGANDVLVEVHASSVNPKDWKLNQNFSSLAPHLGKRAPRIIGDDLAGVILQCGANVKDFAIGNEVYGMDMNWRTAACAEKAVIAQRRIAVKPSNISFAEAAAVPLAGLTALQSLRLGEVGVGSKVLIIGASGGVGTFAVQIAKSLGAYVTAVCSGSNSELATDLGADEVIDYTLGDYRQASHDFNAVFDATSYETPQSCSKLLAENGIFVTTVGHGKALAGCLAATLTPGAPTARMVKVDANTQDLNQLRALIEAGQVRVIIDSEFSLQDINKAYERSKTGRARGKIVINIPS